MALQASEPPIEAQRVARSALGTLAAAGRFSSPSSPSVSPDELVLTQPQQVFTLGLDDLTAARGLGAARPVGWRFLVEHAGRPVAMADTLVDRAGGHQLGQFGEPADGPRAGRSGRSGAEVSKEPHPRARGSR